MAFGEKCVPTYSVHDLFNFFLAPGQLVLFCILFGSIGLGIVYIVKADRQESNEVRSGKSQENSQASVSVPPPPTRGMVVPAEKARAHRPTCRERLVLEMIDMQMLVIIQPSE